MDRDDKRQFNVFGDLPTPLAWPAGGLHPAVFEVLQYFTYAHLPAHLRDVSEPFARLAHHLAHTIESSPQLTIALNKLLEGKDAAVRAALRGADVGRRPAE